MIRIKFAKNLKKDSKTGVLQGFCKDGYSIIDRKVRQKQQKGGRDTEKERMLRMKKSPLGLRLAAGLLAIGLMAGCSQEALQNAATDVMEKYAPPVQKNQTIAEDSKWINSSIDGTIDADTPTNVMDDFYTAVNKDWLLQPLPEGESNEDMFSDVSKQYTDNVEKLMSIQTDDTTGLDPEVMSADELIHIQTLVHKLVDTAADTDARNAAGAEPLRPYIEKISNISTLDELTAYLGSTDGSNPFGLQLAYFTLDAPIDDDIADNYTVMFQPTALLALGDVMQYDGVGESGLASYKYNTQLFQYELQQLGYTEKQATDLLTDCYRFEVKLAYYLPTTSEVQSVDYWNENNHVYDRAGLQELAGNYPVTEILDDLGVGNSETYTVPETLQMEELGRLYTQENLEQMKAYFVVHTVLQAQDLLDETTADMADDFTRQTTDRFVLPKDDTDGSDDPDGGDEPTATPTPDASNYALLRVYNSYVNKYMSDAYQQMYIAHYCTAAAKRDIKAMATEIINTFSQVITEADWMSDETKAAAQEKLSAMGLHVLYPDNLIDYSTLSFDDCSNLVDIVSKINAFDTAQQIAKVNQPVDRSNWDMTTIPTTMVNAMYLMSDNSINICAALLSTDDFYNENNAYEMNLARLGTVLGHEVTHGFDTTGYKYDKNGRYKSWWTSEDQYAYDVRANKLVRYYSTLSPLTRGSFMSGTVVSGEAIADMGGMKFALRMAAQQPDFDYDAFFRAYAEMWRCHRTYVTEAMYISDSHPTGMLRTNVTLMQFDEFENTYDIQPGDGMYLAPENRITVW